MKISFSRYRLTAKREINALSARKERSGALLRVQWPDQTGYADCFPWPELGDPPLDEQLSTLRSGGLTPLLKQSLTCARLDAEGRARGENLLSGLPIPESHYLLTAGETIRESELSEAWAKGFRVLKLKIGSDLKVARLRIEEGLKSPFQLRLDANGSLSPEQVRQLAGDYASFQRIQFWEDPCPYDRGVWESLNREIPLALDQAIHLEQLEQPTGFEVVVYKPAWTDLDRVRHFPRLCVTSALDHPLGQCFAALTAGRLALTKKIEIGGLQSHGVYEQNAFSEALGPVSPRFHAPEGQGLGFDSLLEEQKWTAL